ncbi:MAG: hypothetical protein RI894_2424 [Bacteroidota bacterium]
MKENLDRVKIFDLPQALTMKTFSKKTYLPLFICLFGVLSCTNQSCKNSLFPPKNVWQFETVTLADTSSIPRTLVRYADDKTVHTLDTFCGTFAALPRYLNREDLPDSVVAVCKGQWLGAPKWLCAAQKNGATVFYEADEDNGYYNDDDNELPLTFKLLQRR